MVFLFFPPNRQLVYDTSLSGRSWPSKKFLVRYTVYVLWCIKYNLCVQTCILICRFQSRRNTQNFHRFTGKENYNEWTIIVWGTYISGYKCQNPWKPWYLPGFLEIWKYLNCPRGNKTKTMSFFFRFDYPSAIIFVRMRLISVWIINTVDKARSVINMNIIIYELAML